MTTQAPIRRRFAPEPIETTTRSSTRQSPRKSTPQLVETDPRPADDETKHDSQQEVDHDKAAATPSKKPVRRFAVEPIESTVKRSNGRATNNETTGNDGLQVDKKPRRFAVEPMETTVSKKRNADSTETTAKPPRKFAVEPVETTAKSNHDISAKDAAPKRRFAPEAVESTERCHRSSRRPARRDSELDETPADMPVSTSSSMSTRKFAVELIDTKARSRRASDEKIATPQDFATDVTPGHTIDADGLSVFPSTLLRRKPLLHERRRDKQHSFIAPDLETIASSEDDASEAGTPDRSTSNSPVQDSPLTTSDYLPPKTHVEEPPTSPTESGPTFSQFLMDAERKRAEQLLRDQALAAFPNSDFHEPVEHYMDDEESNSDIIDDRPTTWEGHDEDEEMDEAPAPATLRKETTRINWELIELQKHHENLEQKRVAAEASAARNPDRASPWWNAGIAQDINANAGPDAELSQMRKGARPPMLGADIVFPRSSSPLPARLDTTQASYHGSQTCPLTEQVNAQRGSNRTVNGMWGAPGTSSVSSTESKGLWGGYCAASTESSRQSSVMPSGLVTPAPVDRSNPFEETTFSQRTTPDTLRPPTPPYTRAKGHAGKSGGKSIDALINSERELDAVMERDYPDEFITQVFNYLSLGYPSLARPFDDELSKISSVSMVELRADDAIARSMPKGYIRIGEDFEGRGDGISQELEENKCARWRALKVYVREWAKQEKGMVHVRAPPYGTAPRKGSWAW